LLDGDGVDCVLAFNPFVQELVLFSQQRALVVECADEAIDLELMALEQQLHDSLVAALARLNDCGATARPSGAVRTQGQRHEDLFSVFCVFDFGLAMRNSPSVREFLDLLSLKGHQIG
jgi:hypothetical protein